MLTAVAAGPVDWLEMKMADVVAVGCCCGTYWLDGNGRCCFGCYCSSKVCSDSCHGLLACTYENAKQEPFF